MCLKKKKYEQAEGWRCLGSVNTYDLPEWFEAQVRTGGSAQSVLTSSYIYSYHR